MKDILTRHECKLIEHQGILIDSRFNEDEKKLISVINGEVRIKQATKKGYIVAHDGDGINLSFPKSKTRRGRVISQKSSTLDCQCNISVFYNGILRKLSIIELERLQTLPDGYTSIIESDTVRKKVLGNAWNVDTIAHILKNLKGGNINE